MQCLHLCNLFCYSGYHSVFFKKRQMHLCNRANVRFKRTTTLRNVHSAPLVPTLVPRTIHRTAAGVRTAVAPSLPDPPAPISGVEASEGAAFQKPPAQGGCWTLQGYPAVTEAIVCSHSATNEGQDNNLLVAMK